MIPPRKLEREARKKEKENLEFRAFLKENADLEELDGKFLRLHKQLFAEYDCSRCRNCCKMYKANILEEDIEKDADQLGVTPEQFVDFFLEKNSSGTGYLTKHKPCDFLQEDGMCRLADCKPDNCKKYPYTDRPERLLSLLGMLDIITVCPVAFEIFEQLKNEYGFRRN